MQTQSSSSSNAQTVAAALKQLSREGFPALRFPEPLENSFEADTRQARSHRMWLEGLVAILVLNACLLLDYLVVKDSSQLAVIRQTAFITPVALFINWLVRRNPPRWLRESSVAFAMIGICIVNLGVQGKATTAAAMFGVICMLITALFVGVVMRLRFPYAAASIVAMLVDCLWWLGSAPTMHMSELFMGGSLLFIGTGLILIASYSLEREERRIYLVGMQRDMQAEELAASNLALEHLSLIDQLTGLPNRRSLEARFNLVWESSIRNQTPVSVIVVDADHFKIINDVYGHLYGDETLKRIGLLLPQALRSADDMAARFGGEEFVLLLPHANSTVAQNVAERARQLVETAATPSGLTAHRETLMWITVSCGVSSCIPDAATRWSDLLAAADEALYAAKAAGRNCVQYRDCHASRQANVSEQTANPHVAPRLS